jgi:hypothetical protein
MSQFNARLGIRFHKMATKLEVGMTQSCMNLRPTPAAYVIVLRERVIAQDLAMTIAEYDAQAQVIVVGTAAEAVVALRPEPAVAVAFVAMAPETFMGSDLASAIAARGGRVILLGVEAELQGPMPGWQVLAQPFTTQAVLAHLVTL